MNIFNWKNPPLCTVKISWLLKNCCLHCFNLGLWSQTTWFRLRSDCSKSCLILWPYWSLSLSSPGGAVQKLCAKLWRNLPVWTDCYLNTNKHKHNQKMFSVNSTSCCKNENVLSWRYHIQTSFSFVTDEIHQATKNNLQFLSVNTILKIVRIVLNKKPIVLSNYILKGRLCIACVNR